MIQEIRLRDRHCAFAALRHHCQIGCSSRVDFDGSDPLLSHDLGFMLEHLVATSRSATATSIASVFLAFMLGALNPPNRRIRSRMYGGVGGAESRDSPLSRLTAAGAEAICYSS